MKTVNIQYFAILREQRGQTQETLQTSAATAADLFTELAARHSFTLGPGDLRVAINGDFSSFAAPLNDGDEVVFIPPVAGG